MATELGQYVVYIFIVLMPLHVFIDHVFSPTLVGMPMVQSYCYPDDVYGDMNMGCHRGF